MPTIVATPGAANANSFLTMAEAEAYFETRGFDTNFTGDEGTIISATRIMDTVPWTGSATDPAVQALTWPRTGMLNRNGYPIPSDVVPQELKDATAELSFWVTKGDRFKENVARQQGLQRMKAGKVELWWQEFDKWAESGFSSELIPNAVLQLLVPSWLQVNAVSTTPIFEVI
jgi:hypothetical protein